MRLRCRTLMHSAILTIQNTLSRSDGGVRGGMIWFVVDQPGEWIRSPARSFLQRFRCTLVPAPFMFMNINSYSLTWAFGGIAQPRSVPARGAENAAHLFSNI